MNFHPFQAATQPGRSAVGHASAAPPRRWRVLMRCYGCGLMSELVYGGSYDDEPCGLCGGALTAVAAREDD
jgi:hypothetical protein